MFFQQIRLVSGGNFLFRAFHCYPAATTNLTTMPLKAASPPLTHARSRKKPTSTAFPWPSNYQTMYKQAIDTTSRDYRGTFNTLNSSANVATPEDKFVVTPNSDTPYSYLWMDLRAEPMVVTMPKIEANRYYSAQMVDLYTYNFAYLGTRSYGNDGGKFVIAGPGWNGETPKGVKAVIHSETQFAYVLFRTQLFNLADLPNVHKIQAGYHAEPLSAFLHQPAPPASPAVNWPKYTEEMSTSPAIFPLVNFLFQFCPPNPAEKDILASFAKLKIAQARPSTSASSRPRFSRPSTTESRTSATDFGDVMKKVNTDEIASSDFFGTRDFLKDNYLYRFAGAKMGLYGNTGAMRSTSAISSMPTISRWTLPSTATNSASLKATFRRTKPSGRSPCTTAKRSSS